MLSVFVVPGFDAFFDRECRDDERGGGVGPPPAKGGVEADAGQGGGGGVGAKAVSAESAMRVRLPRAWPVRRLAIASAGMTIRAAALTARPGMDSPGRAWVTRSWMLSMVRKAARAKNVTPIRRTARVSRVSPSPRSCHTTITAAKNSITESRPKPVSAIEEASTPAVMDGGFDHHPHHAGVFQREAAPPQPRQLRWWGGHKRCP